MWVDLFFTLGKLLSQRGEVARDWEDFLNKYLYLCCSDPYDEKDNPKVCTMFFIPTHWYKIV